MSTKEEREALRKQLTGFGRGDLLRLLLEAWSQLDAADAATGSDAILEALAHDDE